MGEASEGAKVTLHKQGDEGLVNKAEHTEPLKETQEDPDELTSEDFQQAAEKAQDTLGHVAQSAQQGVASVLGSLTQTLAPKAQEGQDPEVKDFRASAAEAAAQAQAYMQPGQSSKKPETH